jgi:hypothetical protein
MYDTITVRQGAIDVLEQVAAEMPDDDIKAGYNSILQNLTDIPLYFKFEDFLALTSGWCEDKDPDYQVGVAVAQTVLKGIVYYERQHHDSVML